MEENILEISNLHVEYRGDHDTVHAVNGISLEIPKGKTLGLVGETGAGKTTTALSVLSLLPRRVGYVTEGEIIFDGRSLSSLSEKDYRAIRGNEISMIFQDPMTSLNPVLRVSEQLGEVLILHGKADRKSVDEATDRLMELVGIPPERKDDYPHQFSGGMKQRIVIAMALACEPRLLIADEPTTALDVTIQAQVLEIMDDLRRKMGMSMLLITHDLGIVVQCCDSVAIMYAGEIVEKGSVEDIFTPGIHHPYTIGLFNSIPSLEGDTERLEPIEGAMPDPTCLPVGCPFAPRCHYATDECRNEKPEEKLYGTKSVKCRREVRNG